VGCLCSKRQLDVAFSEIKKTGIADTNRKTFLSIQEKAYQRIESLERLKNFYEKMGVFKDNKKLIDKEAVNQLGLDPFREGAMILIDLINKMITNNRSSHNVQKKRYLKIDLNHPELIEYEDKSWVVKVLNPLVDQGYLFKIEKMQGTFVFIQA
jgi:hypothetical protein